MSPSITPIIHPQELLALQGSPNLVLIDARSGPDVKARYTANHLAGALHADLDTDLADIKPNAADGGRHPLPSPAQFSKVLGKLGITPESLVVVYDDKNGANAAARFWWMLRAVGHQQVQVLNGGLNAAIEAGFPVLAGEEIAAPVEDYPIQDWSLPLADIAEVEQAGQDPQRLIIDVREKVRYDGITEPIDLVAGHIPGAINVPFAHNLDSQGFYLSPEALHEQYAAVLNNRKPEEVIVHCGSGVTACHTLLALDYAGFEIPKLYVGSWSEWSRSEKPRA
ncbi:MAG TPA: sulfurtransferase [Haliscomenobacter sp.]|uniref:sulfurtransferase n=1 Tax=Haliscomenobacter sp. TaxID=2717303 RepID=UPI002C82FABC|nr:sulfurtransferase [Haliscomenobacter sp.]HOY16056.1 sulfurtransferase [Haliscomenobacter sp.]